MKKVVLAGGCFWGVEAYFDSIKGVRETYVGYVNGNSLELDYEKVCTGTTGAMEAVSVLYDDKEISLEELLIKYLVVVDPTLINRQGPDIGTQYASGVFCNDEEDLKIVRNFFLKKQADYASKIMVKVDKVNSFVKAEEYHQKYLDKNPNGYCHIDRSLFSK